MKMSFKLLDYTVSILMGTGTLSAVYLIVDKEWNMLVAMIAGMVIGMIVLLLTVLLFIPISTAFELFPTGMVITMLIGMVVGMMTSMRNMDFMSMLFPVIGFSLFVQLLMDLYNLKLMGEVPLDK